MSAHREIDSRVSALVRVDQILRNHNKPNIPYVASKEFLERYRAERDRLASELGLSEDPKKRDRQISGHRARLTKVGHRYWEFNGVPPMPRIPGVNADGLNGTHHELQPGKAVEVGEPVENPV